MYTTKRHRKPKNKRNKNKQIAQESLVAKPTTRVALRFNNNTQKTGSGVDYINWYYRANSVYDPDPLILSDGAAGFSAYANLYNRYRVSSFKVTAEISNVSGFISTAIMRPLLTAQTFDKAGWQSQMDMPNSVHATMGPVGSGQERVILHGNWSIQTLVGSPETRYDRGYSAAIDSNPDIPIFLNFGVISGTNSNTQDDGVNINVTIEYATDFYYRSDVPSDGISLTMEGNILKLSSAEVKDMFMKLHRTPSGKMLGVSRAGKVIRPSDGSFVPRGSDLPPNWT
jgi:hypothetical protein